MRGYLLLLIIGFCNADDFSSLRFRAPNQTSTANGHGPQLAVDGDLSTCSQTSGPGEWYIPLKGVAVINDVQIEVSSGSLGRLIHQAQVYAGEVFCGEIIYKAGTTSFSISCDGIPAGIIRIRQQFSALSICEFKLSGRRVLGYAGLLHNIAPGHNTWMSSVAHGGEAARSNDGNTNSLWSQASCSHSQYNYNNTWQVNLMFEYSIDRVVVHHRRDSGTGKYINGMEVHVGEVMCGKIHYIPNVFVYSVKCPPGHRASSVKLVQNHDYMMQCEVQVLATEGSMEHVKEQVGPLLSVDFPTDQSTTNGVYRSALAVDGNTNPNLNAMTCSLTGANTGNWFRLRLMRPTKIQVIKIYKELRYGAYVNQAKVYVGDEFCGQVLHQNAQKVYSFSCGGAVGDTVWVYQDANYLSMCELEVYGQFSTDGEELLRLKGGFPTSGGNTDRFKVIDGGKSGRWSDRSCTNLNPAWFGVDYLESYLFKKVVVHTRMDTVDSTTDGAVITVNGEYCGTVEWKRGIYVYPVECENGGLYGNNVQIHGQGTTMNLCELEPLVTKSSYDAANARIGENVALKKETEMTRTSGQYVSKLAVDGKRGGVLAHGFCAQTIYPGAFITNEWKVNLNGLYRVSQVHIYPRTDAYVNYLNKAKVYLDQQFCGEVIYWDRIPFYQISCGNMIGETVRIIGTEREMTLCEVEVYGKEADEDDVDPTEPDPSPTVGPTESPFVKATQESLRWERLVNVAPGHVTSQSEVYSYGYAANGNDNRTNGVWGHQSCIHTQVVHVTARPTVWWKVNLVFNYHIRKVVVHNRLDGSFHHINGVKVYAGEHECGEITYVPQQYTYVMDCGTDVYANSVKLVQDTPGLYLLVCEVEVMVPQRNVDLINSNIGDNLAQGKPTKQTTTQTAHATYGTYTADLAVDGRTSGVLTDKTCAKTISNNYFSRWEVNLEGRVHVNVIKIFGVTGSSLLNKAKVYVGEVFCAQLFVQPKQHVWMVECGDAVGFSVSVVQDEGQLELCEVQVFGHYVMNGTLLTNVALQKNTQQSSTVSGGEAARAVDGHPNSVWARQTCTYTSNTANAYWMVNLLASYEIRTVVIHVSSNYNPALVAGAEVIVAGRWGSEVTCGQMMAEPGTFVYKIQCPPSTVASTVRVRHEKASLILCEVEVLATRESVNRVEDGLGWIISQGMNTEQSSVEGTALSENAVDGNYTQRHGSHGVQCAVTLHKTNSWWKVHFDEIKVVTRVVIYNRLDRYPERLNTANIYVGETFCGQVLYQKAQTVYTMDCDGIVGSEVVIRNDNGAIQLCEVEVRGHSVA